MSTTAPRRVLPARRLLLSLAGASLALAWQPALGLGAILALLGLGLLDAALAARLDDVITTGRAPARLGQGQRARLDVELWNRGGRTLTLQAAADVPAPLDGTGADEPHARTCVLPPRARLELGWPLHARRRGPHPLGNLHLRVLGPLRLAWWQAARPLGRRVDVVPGLSEVRRHRLLAWHHRSQQAGLRQARERGDGGAFESLRGYVRGDDPRRIDWKATARHGSLIVRRYEAERSQNVMLCIDCGRLMSERVGPAHQPVQQPVQRLDAALAAAVVLADVAAVWHDQVGVMLFSDRVHALLPPARHPPERIPELLMSAEARNVEPDYPRALARLSRLLSRRSLVVLFSDVIDAEVSGPLAAHAAHLARRHLPLFVAMRHVELVEAARAPVHDLAGAYHRAAAAELRLARASTLEGMRRAGIHVLDVPPGAAVTAAVNHYLEVKRRGAL